MEGEGNGQGAARSGQASSCWHGSRRIAAATCFAERCLAGRPRQGRGRPARRRGAGGGRSREPRSRCRLCRRHHDRPGEPRRGQGRGPQYESISATVASRRRSTGGSVGPSSTWATSWGTGRPPCWRRSSDPIHLCLCQRHRERPADVPEARAGREAGRLPRRERRITLDLGLRTSRASPTMASIDYTDQTVDPGTGTLPARGKLPRPGRGRSIPASSAGCACRSAERMTRCSYPSGAGLRSGRQVLPGRELQTRSSIANMHTGLDGGERARDRRRTQGRRPGRVSGLQQAGRDHGNPDARCRAAEADATNEHPTARNRPRRHARPAGQRQARARTPT